MPQSCEIADGSGKMYYGTKDISIFKDFGNNLL